MKRSSLGWVQEEPLPGGSRHIKGEKEKKIVSVVVEPVENLWLHNFIPAPILRTEEGRKRVTMFKKVTSILLFLTLSSSLVVAHGEDPKAPGVETDPKAFKMLKEKSVNPKTGLPTTLDPNRFKGKAKRAYQIAREIPEVLAQMPCLCECEAFGHENLLDCFIDEHGAG